MARIHVLACASDDPGQRSSAIIKSTVRQWAGEEKKIIIGLSALLAVIALTRLVSLGAFPLMDPTEGRYADIARVMVESGNWVTPQLEPGVPFWGKPPLWFWLTSLCYKVFGVHEFSARLPSFLFAVLTAALTFALGNSLRGKVFGLCCAVILSTSTLFYVIAGLVMLDGGF